MTRILEAFAYGNVDPQERWLECCPGYREAVRAVTEREQALVKVLDEEAGALYEELAEARRDMMSMNDAERFVAGYRLGALMMMEIMSGKDELLG